jgi:hypothetical protein
MKKTTTYLLLAVLCVNIFGAGTGELALEGSELQWHTHTHHHDAVHAHQHEEGHHAAHHRHHEAISLLLETFSALDEEASEQCLLHLNWLMLSLTGLLSTVHYASTPEVSLETLSLELLLPYQSIHTSPPSPPPKRLS